MGSPVVHFEILAADSAPIQQFYRDLFGWKVDTDNPMNYGVVAAEEGGIGGGIADHPAGGSAVTIYVQVPDLQATLDAVEKAGGKTVVPVTEIPGMVTFAQFSDPAGNVIGIVT